MVPPWGYYLGVEKNEERANRVAKNIDSIFITKNDEDSWKKVAKDYYSYTGENLNWSDARDKFEISNPENNQCYVAACKCYEYMQFKRSIFKCEGVTAGTSGITYDDTTGRVKGIYIKFDELK